MISGCPRALAPTARVVVILLLGLGLVLMHHAVGSLPDTTGGTPTPTAGTDSTAGHHGTDEHDGTGPSGAPHGDHASMALHLCLAVLGALATALLVAAIRPGRPRDDDVAAPHVLAVPPVPRPPPVPVRLARLQVLRL